MCCITKKNQTSSLTFYSLLSCRHSQGNKPHGGLLLQTEETRGTTAQNCHLKSHGHFQKQSFPGSHR